MGDSASEAWARAGKWGPKQGTGGKLHSWNVDGSGVHRSVLGSVVQWTEPGGGGCSRCLFGLCHLPAV